MRWAEFDSVLPFFPGGCVCNQFEVFHHLADREAKLVTVNNSGELPASFEQRPSFAQKILSCDTRMRPRSEAPFSNGDRPNPRCRLPVPSKHQCPEPVMRS